MYWTMESGGNVLLHFDEKFNIDEAGRRCKSSPACRREERGDPVFDRRGQRLQYITWPNAGMVDRLPESGGVKITDQLRYATNKKKVRWRCFGG